MTITSARTRTTAGSVKRTVKVSRATVTAARGRVLIAGKLGRQPSKAAQKIAKAR